MGLDRHHPLEGAARAAASLDVSVPSKVDRLPERRVVTACGQRVEVDIVELLIILLVVGVAVGGWFLYNTSRRRGKILMSPPQRPAPKKEDEGQP